MNKFILSIDQGTTSTRAIIFDHNGNIVARDQVEHTQIFPRAGWVEHDALEIWRNTRTVVAKALSVAEINHTHLAAVGITNQRETVVVWDKTTGKPIYNAIVWQDTRTDEICKTLAISNGPHRYKQRCGLPIATYFSGPKVKWIIDNIPKARDLAENGTLLLGTIDSWLLWNLTGGVENGVHATDVTNASRTMIMNLHTLDWDPDICADMDIPLNMLPKIHSCSEIYGYGRDNGLLSQVPICGILGDQQAAMFGQTCFYPGMAKNTYGTGCFLLLNTGHSPINSHNGLLTTLCYKIKDQKPVYALEGSVAVTGSIIQWLRDNLGIIQTASEVETLAKSVSDNGGVYFVPAFSGLFAPYWKGDARGVIVGMTRYNTKAHLARAALEACAFQTKEVLEAMNQDAAIEMTQLRVDGGMIANELLMQFQADILSHVVVAPKIAETTALGAAYAAGLAVGYWNNLEELTQNWQIAKMWNPQMPRKIVEQKYRLWKKAVSRTFAWVDEDVLAEQQPKESQ